MRRLLRGIGPRLGRLVQHPPVPLRLPAHHRATVPASELPSISLVTPSRNQGLFLERTIRSVLDQEYGNLEYIIQDGGSDDGTLGILKRYGRSVSSAVSEPDRGQAHALNKGFNRSSGEVMAWLNSDDILMPCALNYVGEYFARNPGVDAIYGNRILIDEHDMEVGRWILPPHDNEVLRYADFVPQETLYWRRRIWEATDSYIDETYDFAMDWELLLRFIRMGGNIVHVPRFLGAFRVHNGQKTSLLMAGKGREEMTRLREAYKPENIRQILLNRLAVARYLIGHLFRHARWRLSRSP